MGRSPPLPHHPQRRRQRGTADAQYAGRSGLINIKRDDALLHYLTGHYLKSGAQCLALPLHVEANKLVGSAGAGTEHLQYRADALRFGDGDAVIPCDLPHVRKVGMAEDIIRAGAPNAEQPEGIFRLASRQLVRIIRQDMDRATAVYASEGDERISVGADNRRVQRRQPDGLRGDVLLSQIFRESLFLVFVLAPVAASFPGRDLH